MPPIRHDKRKTADRPSLADIFNGPDEFGLLDVQAKKSSSGAPLEVSRFEGINEFIDQYARPPASTGELLEKLLARRLKGYKENSELQAGLKPYDRHNLLPKQADPPADTASSTVEFDGHSLAYDGELTASQETTKDAENVTSLDDIFASESFADIDQGDATLFNPVHVSFEVDRQAPDEIAQRRVCKDFYAFESLFRELHEKLRLGNAKRHVFRKRHKCVKATHSFLRVSCA